MTIKFYTLENLPSELKLENAERTVIIYPPDHIESGNHIAFSGETNPPMKTLQKQARRFIRKIGYSIKDAIETIEEVSHHPETEQFLHTIHINLTDEKLIRY